MRYRRFYGALKELASNIELNTDIINYHTPLNPKHYTNPLFLALAAGDPKSVDILLSKGASPSQIVIIKAKTRSSLDDHITDLYNFTIHLREDSKRNNPKLHKLYDEIAILMEKKYR